MARVITFSRTFPSYHPKKGQPTYFVEKIHKALAIAAGLEVYSFNELKLSGYDMRQDFKPKFHTIRGGHRWQAGDKASLRVWSGLPYRSVQIEIAPEIVIPKTIDFKLTKLGFILIDNKPFKHLGDLPQNDGLSTQDFKDWFKVGKEFDGQIIFLTDHKTSY